MMTKPLDIADAQHTGDGGVLCVAEGGVVPIGQRHMCDGGAGSGHTDGEGHLSSLRAGITTSLEREVTICMESVIELTLTLMA